MSSRPAAKLTYTALLGQILQHHRQRLGLQQSDVAAVLGILQPAYSRIEKGDTSITVAQLRIVARRLGMAPAQILHDTEQWVQHLRTQRKCRKPRCLLGWAFLQPRCWRHLARRSNGPVPCRVRESHGQGKAGWQGA
jgi:transcriptional regulator with XRE-family HTH domain